MVKNQNTIQHSNNSTSQSTKDLIDFNETAKSTEDEMTLSIKDKNLIDFNETAESTEDGMTLSIKDKDSIDFNETAKSTEDEMTLSRKDVAQLEKMISDQQAQIKNNNFLIHSLFAAITLPTVIGMATYASAALGVTLQTIGIGAIGLIGAVAAVGVIGLCAYKIYQHREDIKEATEKAASKVKDGAEYVASKVKDGAEYVASKVKDDAEYVADKTKHAAHVVHKGAKNKIGSAGEMLLKVSGQHSKIYKETQIYNKDEQHNIEKATEELKKVSKLTNLTTDILSKIKETLGSQIDHVSSQIDKITKNNEKEVSIDRHNNNQLTDLSDKLTKLKAQKDFISTLTPDKLTKLLQKNLRNVEKQKKLHDIFNEPCVSIAAITKECRDKRIGHLISNTESNSNSFKKAEQPTSNIDKTNPKASLFIEYNTDEYYNASDKLIQDQKTSGQRQDTLSASSSDLGYDSERDSEPGTPQSQHRHSMSSKEQRSNFWTPENSKKFVDELEKCEQQRLERNSLHSTNSGKGSGASSQDITQNSKNQSGILNKFSEILSKPFSMLTKVKEPSPAVTQNIIEI
jgi:hypothetical protein